MILVDTNVISEMMKSHPDPAVVRWFDQQQVMQLFITSITIAEISYGINILPQGARRIALEKAFVSAISEAFTNRILIFDEFAAHLYGKIMAHRKMLGQPLGIPDGQIAAIARVHGALLVTRNVRDFTNCELQLFNPFASH